MIPIKHKLISILVLSLIFSFQAGFADGFIVIPRENRPVGTTVNSFPLEVKYHHVTVSIKERTAVTAIDQVFYNPEERILEGEYIFPIPKGAVLKNFSMYIDGKETNAELLDATKARTIYEDIVRKTLDPALLEYQGTNIFHVRIFPIEPRKEKRVKISYSEILNKENALVEYVYPLNTEKFSARPLSSASISVTLETEEKIKNVFSTTHSIATVYKSDKKAVTSWEANDVTPDTDFKLYFMLAEAEFGVSLLAYRQQPEDGFFFLDINPGFWDSKNTKVPKDITFILDVSGSMAGDKLAKAKNALLYCLSALSGEDRFALIKFSTEAEVFLDRIVPADTANLGRAKDFINNLIAVGGTNIEDALSLALSLNAVNDETRAQLIVFITDGKPTIGETDADRLVAKIKKSNTHNMRIFTVGIDTSLDTILLDKITTATRAYRAYISPKEDIETKIKAFYQKLDAPVFAHISLSIAGNVQLFKTEPKLTELPDLFLGTSLTLLGRYRGDGKATITVKGIVGNRSAEFTYELSFPAADTKYDTIPPLWASRRVGFLLEQMRLYGESKEVVDEIILLARTHGIITPYTSYLILEDETGRVTRNELSRRDQTLRNVAPEGSEFEKKSKTEFDSLKEESGTGAVTASGEVQALRNAQANDVAKSSLPRLSAKDKNGKDINIQSQVKNIKGRAFYNSGVEWNDSNIQNRKIKNTKRIQFASKEYFDLLAKNPETNAYLSLGKNVRFMVGDDLYEIFE